MAGDEDDPIGLLRIYSAQNRIDVRDLRGFGNSFCWLFEKRIGLNFEASTTIFGIAFEFGLDPLARGSDAFTRLDRIIILCGKSGSVSKADQFIDRLPDALRRDLLQDGGNVRISGRWAGRLSPCRQTAKERKRND
jgi:hypothetical protein